MPRREGKSRITIDGKEYVDSNLFLERFKSGIDNRSAIHRWICNGMPHIKHPSFEGSKSHKNYFNLNECEEFFEGLSRANHSGTKLAAEWILRAVRRNNI